MKHIHVVLVSAQPIPSITPILDERTRPDKVILIVSPDMQGITENIMAVYKPRGVAVEKYVINDAWDIEYIRDHFFDLLAQYEHEVIALNVTGGTKPMSTAAYETFRAFDKEIFYVHPEHDRLVWMHPSDRPGIDLADRIKLPEFLQSYGATVVQQGAKTGVPEAMRKLSARIIRELHSFHKPLKTLNYYAALAEGRLEVELKYHDLKNHALMELIELFADCGQLQLNGRQLRFQGEDARFLVNGGWLEQHVYGICISLKKPAVLQDIGRSLKVSRTVGNSRVENELDVAFLKDNRLYLIECKTARFKGSGAEHSKGAETIYKLDTMMDIMGGIQTRAMLVSYQKLPHYDLNRARDLGIQFCSFTELDSLKQRLQHWVTEH